MAFSSLKTACGAHYTILSALPEDICSIALQYFTHVTNLDNIAHVGTLEVALATTEFLGPIHGTTPGRQLSDNRVSLCASPRDVRFLRPYD
jgi:hypothetical protein